MMLNGNLNLVLESLWASTITTFGFDYFNHELTLDLCLLEGRNESNHQVKIKGICGLSWINNSGSSRYNLEGPPHSELTSISSNYESKEVVRIDGEWCCNYRLTPNLVLEIWDQILLIEASKIEV